MSNKIFIANADLPVGDMIAHELLLGKQRDRFDEVICLVHKIEYSGNLWAIGGCLVERSDKKDVLVRQMENVETLVLVPDCTHHRMVEHARFVVEAAKQARVKHCIVMSILGAEEDTETSKLHREMEEICKKEMPNCLIVRHALYQQHIFWFLKFIKSEQKLPLPWKSSKDTQTGFVNLYDVARFVGHLCAEEDRKKIAMKSQVFKLTGPELFTGESLVETINRNAGLQVKFESTSEQNIEKYMKDVLGLNDIMIRSFLDGWKLINQGKLNFISEDEKKTAGIEPIKLSGFVSENKNRFSHRGGF